MKRSNSDMTIDAKPKRFFIETWGCQMNVHDSEKLSGSLRNLGYVRTGSENDADVIILNTCSVREKAEEKVFARLRQFTQIKKSRPLLIGVAGCVAQQQGGEIFTRAPYVDFVLGTQSVVALPRVMEAAREKPVVETGRHPENLDISPEQIERVATISALFALFLSLADGSVAAAWRASFKRLSP